jgi:hypothetical protein
VSWPEAVRPLQSRRDAVVSIPGLRTGLLQASDLERYGDFGVHRPCGHVHALRRHARTMAAVAAGWPGSAVWGCGVRLLWRRLCTRRGADLPVPHGAPRNVATVADRPGQLEALAAHGSELSRS